MFFFRMIIPVGCLLLHHTPSPLLYLLIPDTTCQQPGLLIPSLQSFKPLSYYLYHHSPPCVNALSDRQTPDSSPYRMSRFTPIVQHFSLKSKTAYIFIINLYGAFFHKELIFLSATTDDIMP